MLNVCPRCQNSEIKAEDNFCKICGLDLISGVGKLTIWICPYCKTTHPKRKSCFHCDTQLRAVKVDVPRISRTEITDAENFIKAHPPGDIGQSLKSMASQKSV